MTVGNSNDFIRVALPSMASHIGNILTEFDCFGTGKSVFGFSWTNEFNRDVDNFWQIFNVHFVD